MAAAAAAIAVAGTALSTYAQVKSADTLRKQKEQEANAIQGSTQVGIIQERRKFNLATGEANALGASSGLSLTSGSPLFMELDRAKQSAIATQSIARAGTMQANQARFEGSLAKKSIPWTIIGGALNAGSILSQYKANNPSFSTS